jgi:membrane fusion protein (multidrug efflux system)
MKKSFWVLMDVLIVFLVMGCGAGEKKEEVKKVVPKVETFVLQKDRLATELNLPGELISFQQVDLYAR